MATDNGPLEVSEQDERSYRHLTLANQLQVLLISDPETDKASAAMDVRVGAMSDPEDTQGIAHFLEHMLFMGTEKYPDENEYSKYLSAHGGMSNAYTAGEDTVYYFDVNAEHLEGALDRFAQFFIAPLFTASATAREMNAVDSENAKNQQADLWRMMQLKKSFARSSHPHHLFSTGNLQTLKDLPQEAGVDLRERLIAFHGKYYSANQMRLVVLGKEPLDVLHERVLAYFTDVKDLNVERPLFESNPYDQLGFRVNVVPVRDSRLIELTWQLPFSPHADYASKPSSYLSHLLGHEGAGSVLSLLKAKGWANGLSAGQFASASDFAIFGCQIDCTDEGIANVENVVGVVYEYLAMLRKEGPQEWVFNESRDIAAMNFRFKSKSKPISYTPSVASSMQIYPPARTLSGGTLFYEYDPVAVTKVLDCLVPANMLLLVAARCFEGQTNLEERWYGTKHTKEPLSSDLLAAWANPQAASENASALFLPPPNDFVATDFNLKQLDEEALKLQATASAAAAPSGSEKEGGMSSYEAADRVPAALVHSDPVLDVWYKHFGRFQKPKLNVMVALNTPEAYASPNALVLTALYASMVEEELNEFAYAADLAGLTFELSATRYGLELCCFGYSHKLPLLLEKAAATVAKPALDPATFVRLKDKLHKSYLNFAYAQPYQHALLHESLVLEVPRWDYDSRIEALLPLTVADLKAFQGVLLGRLKVTALVHGNATSSEAIAAAQTVVHTLQPKPLFAARPASAARVVELPPKTTVVHRARGANSEDSNSAIEVVFQVGQAYEPLPSPEGDSAALHKSAIAARLALLMHLAKEPCFDELRTQQQLGYMVFSGALGHGDGHVVAMRFIVQSEVADPIHLDGRIEAFLTNLRVLLAETLSDEEFEANRGAVREKLCESYKNLNEETGALWGKVQDGSMDFGKKWREAEVVATLTRQDVLLFFDQYLGLESPHRRKISLQVFGSKHAIPPHSPVYDPIFDAALAKTQAEEKEAKENGDSTAEKDEKANAAAAADTEEGGSTGDKEGEAAAKELTPAPEVPGPVIEVGRDHAAFHRSRPLYPHRPKSNLLVKPENSQDQAYSDGAVGVAANSAVAAPSMLAKI